MKLHKHSYLPLLVIFLLASISCKKNQQEVEKEHLSTAIYQSKTNNNYRWIIVMPGLGCHGCIQEGEAFMRDHLKSDKILFVLTKISSLKILQQKIGMKVAEHPNVYIDRKDAFVVPTDNRIYPCILKIEKGQLTSHEFQSPKNGDAFAKLNSIVSVQ